MYQLNYDESFNGLVSYGCDLKSKRQSNENVTDYENE